MRCDAWPADRAWPGVRPLWLAYQNLDRNQRLDGVATDRIWAITDFSRNHLVAFADFEKALSEVSLEDGECLRRANGGGFSPFVSGFGSQYFYVSSAAISEFTLTLNPSGFPEVLLRCGSSYSSSQNPVLEPTLLAVAPALAFDGCTDEATCTRVSYQNDWVDATQAISAPGFYRAPYCVRAGELEVLWILEGRSECTDCSCVSHVQGRGWVVSRAATPPDWPCGGSVEICATPSDQAEVIPSDCLL